MSIVEVARIEILEGHEAAFEAAVSQAMPLFREAEGCLDMRLDRSIEQPRAYRLVVGWRTIEHHVEGFRNSPAFATWRELVQPHFAAAPEVEHVETVLTGFR